jgi:MFS family permease
VERRDVVLIYLTAFVRAAAVSAVGVTLAIYLASTGFSPSQIGLLIGMGLAGSSVGTVLVSLRADAWGRRRLLAGLAALSAAGYFALVFFSQAPVLIPLAFVGMLNGMGRDRGAISTLDQAILPATVPDTRRTWALAWYNLALDIGHALGALAGVIPSLLMWAAGLGSGLAHRFTFALCGLATVACSVAYGRLTSQIEISRSADPVVASAPMDARSRRVITRLALLFGLDSIGGGFLSSALIAYWFFQEHGTSEAALALLFFTARLLNAVSHVGAAWLAARVGLLNTMVWTHLPSSLLLIAAPAAPTASLASALFLAREGLVEMDVPTRQSYVMAVVKPEERTFASGVTNLTRNVAWAAGPPLAGLLMQHLTLAGPLVVGGALKVAYDLLLYREFRHLRPPEEDVRKAEPCET